MAGPEQRGAKPGLPLMALLLGAQLGLCPRAEIIRSVADAGVADFHQGGDLNLARVLVMSLQTPKAGLYRPRCSWTCLICRQRMWGSTLAGHMQLVSARLLVKHWGSPQQASIAPAVTKVKPICRT